MKKEETNKNKNKTIKYKIIVFVISLIIAFSASGIGSMFTSNNVKSDWYDSIRPSITPPNIVFPVVWTILFFLIALSMYFAWISSKNKKEKRIILYVFISNLLLNILWSFLFFGLRNPILGFIDILLVLASIILCIFSLWKISRTSSYLLVPYLIWVGFASLINYLAAF